MPASVPDSIDSMALLLTGDAPSPDWDTTHQAPEGVSVPPRSKAPPDDVTFCPTCRDVPVRGERSRDARVAHLLSQPRAGTAPQGSRGPHARGPALRGLPPLAADRGAPLSLRGRPAALRAVPAPPPRAAGDIRARPRSRARPRRRAHHPRCGVAARIDSGPWIR